MTTELCFTSARDLARLIRSRAVSAREVMSAFLRQIARLNPHVNAIVAMLPDDGCLALADEADRRLARGEAVGPLHGLPIAFKDAEPAVGFPWTRGSRIFADARPTEDSVLVARLRAAGAIPIGKTNISEFTMGSQTYNRVYGTTVNPYDLSRTAGGSSGGAAAAVAAGMLPVADGSDLGGSLRNPASFNNLVTLRPTVGLVPNAPTAFPLIEFLAKGALARSAGDVALVMAVIAGQDARDPRSVPSNPSAFLAPPARDLAGVRVAWCPDLGGLPLHPDVRSVLERQRSTLQALGCLVEDAAPDLAEADEIFLTLRAWMSAHTLGPLLEQHRGLMKPEAVWQIELGLRQTAASVGRAMLAHTALLDRMRRFQERFDVIACAASQVPPFDATLPWPHEIDGVTMENYIAWMKSASRISATLRPAVSVPAGFTPEGLPVGLQLVGRMGDDQGLLQFASTFEQATGFGRTRPACATA